MHKTRTEIVTVTEEAEVLEDILCDRCGESCRRFRSKEDPTDIYEYATITANWGYHSNRDTESHSALICEKCFDSVTKDFKHPTFVRYYMET